MPQSESEAWEALCQRCGRCCYEKIEYEGEIYYTDKPCEKLDVASGLCNVYQNRHLARPGCTALTPEIIRQGIMPSDCPYVSRVGSCKAPHPWAGDEHLPGRRFRK